MKCSLCVFFFVRSGMVRTLTIFSPILTTFLIRMVGKSSDFISVCTHVLFMYVVCLFTPQRRTTQEHSFTVFWPLCLWNSQGECTLVHLYSDTHTHTHTHACKHVCTHTHTHTRTHTHTHTHTHHCQALVCSFVHCSSISTPTSPSGPCSEILTRFAEFETNTGDLASIQKVEADKEKALKEVSSWFSSYYLIFIIINHRFINYVVFCSV